jgi:hypothetical protein
MDITQGTRAESPCLDSDAYEARITGLFAPFLTDGIPEKRWQTVTEKLGCIVRDIIAGKEIKPFAKRGRPRRRE